MFPALLGAFANVVGAGLGASAASKADDTNWDINLLNYYQRERERNDAIQQGRHQEHDTKLGATDAAGNRTYFKPGVGWVTDLAPQQKTLQDAYQREEEQQLLNDLPKKRGVLNANVKRQRGEDVDASALRDAFGRLHRTDPAQTEALMNAASVRGINEGYDTTLADAMRSSIRTGASNSGKVAAAIGEQKSKALVDAFLNNKINAQGQASQEYDAARSNLANLYNMFASRASAMPDVAYNPRNIEGLAAQQLGQTKGSADQAAGALLNAFAKQGGTMMPVEPNYGPANAFITGGNALAQAFDSSNADAQRRAAFENYGKYTGLDPSMYKLNSGAF